MKAPFLLGRMIFGGFFLYNGVHLIKDYKQLAKHAESKHIPLPELSVLASGAMLTLGGASVLLGVKPKLGTLAILGFLATASPTMHDFWNDKDPAQQQANKINFMKNVALMGGALAMLGVDQPWPASIESENDEEEEEVEERPMRLSQRRSRAA